MNTIDLEVFCEYRSCSKYDFSEPFVLHGYRYGTDAFIAARVPVSEDDTPGTWPDVESIFDGFDDGEFVPLPSKAKYDASNCDNCSGLKHTQCECCGTALKCRQCDGTGKDRWRLRTGGPSFSPRYYKMLSKIGQSVEVREHGAKLFFRYGPVQGVLAAMFEDGEA